MASLAFISVLISQHLSHTKAVALVESRPDSAFTASSEWSDGSTTDCAAEQARWSGTGWCVVQAEVDSGIQQWLQIDLGNNYVIQQISTTSTIWETDQEWVESYIVKYKTQGGTWETYPTSGTLSGNTGWNTNQTNNIDIHMVARYLQFEPQTWNNYPSMRVEVYGHASDPTKSPTAVPTKTPTKTPTTPIPNPTKAPSHLPTTPEPTKSPNTHKPTTIQLTTANPTKLPTMQPTTANSTKSPTKSPTQAPTNPSNNPTFSPFPTRSPSDYVFCEGNGVSFRDTKEEKFCKLCFCDPNEFRLQESDCEDIYSKDISEWKKEIFMEECGFDIQCSFDQIGLKGSDNINECGCEMFQCEPITNDVNTYTFEIAIGLGILSQLFST